MYFKTTQFRKQKGILYSEFDHTNNDIQYIWKLETEKSLDEFLEYKIIPDGSIDIVFEEYQGSLFNPSISAPFSKITSIKLIQKSKYIGIRFYPGKFRKYINIDPSELVEDFLYFNKREFRNIDEFLKSLHPSPNDPLRKYDNNLYNLLNSSLSQKQKRRIFKCCTGFTMRDFNKIMNFQRSLVDPLSEAYCDQSHKIKSYKSLVDITPLELQRYF